MSNNIFCKNQKSYTNTGRNNYESIFRKMYTFKIFCFKCLKIVGKGETYFGNNNWMDDIILIGIDNYEEKIILEMINFDGVMAHQCSVCNEGKLVIYSKSFKGEGFLYSPVFPDYNLVDTDLKKVISLLN